MNDNKVFDLIQAIIDAHKAQDFQKYKSLKNTFLRHFNRMDNQHERQKLQIMAEINAKDSGLLFF